MAAAQKQRQNEEEEEALADVINIGRFIDDRPVSAFQIRVICLCALVVGLDGFDAQALGFVAPALSKDLHLQPGALGPVFGASLFGVMIGSLLFGALADYFGRKWLVIAGVLVFALGIAGDQQGRQRPPTCVILRFLTGLGLGGVLPNTIALTGEYSPQRRRTLLIMLMFMTVSLGSAIGGSVAAKLITAYGWQVIFVIGGILPLILCPDPDRLAPGIAFAARARRTERTAASARCWRGSIRRPSSAADARFAIVEETGKGFLLPQLFTNGRLVPTLLLVGHVLHEHARPLLPQQLAADADAWRGSRCAGRQSQSALRFSFGGMFGTVGLGLLDRAARLPPRPVPDLCRRLRLDRHHRSRRKRRCRSSCRRSSLLASP